MEESLTYQLEEIKSIFKEKKSFKEKVEFEAQMLAFTFLSEIEREMDKMGMKKKDLAQAVGTSAGYITQLFRGNKLPNLTILAAMGIAVGKQFNVVPVDSLEEARNQEPVKINANLKLKDDVAGNIIPIKSSKKKREKAKSARS